MLWNLEANFPTSYSNLVEFIIFFIFLEQDSVSFSFLFWSSQCINLNMLSLSSEDNNCLIQAVSCCVNFDTAKKIVLKDCIKHCLSSKKKSGDILMLFRIKNLILLDCSIDNYCDECENRFKREWNARKKESVTWLAPHYIQELPEVTKPSRSI